MTILNLSGRAQSGVYPFHCAPVWHVSKIYIAAAAAPLAAAEPLKFPTKFSMPLTDLNANFVDALATTLATKLSRKRWREEATSDAQSYRVAISDPEIETEEEDKNHIRTASLRDTAMPKYNKQNVM